jgi:DNA-binding winged helix-turn-helix (wHTH) protein/TolB-like protein
MPIVLRFDRFEFHPQSGELIAGGETTRLEPQPAKVLAILASRAGQVVTREELQKEVWPAEIFVDFERGLNYCVGRIRRALDDSAAAPRFVETLPKRGYRFLPAVEPSPEVQQPLAESPASPSPGWGRRHGRRRLGVAWRVATAAVLLAALVAAGSAFVRSRRAAMVPTVAITRFDNETGRADLDGTAQVLEDTLVERLAREPERWSVIGNAAILREPRPVRNLEAIGSSLHADLIVLGQILPGERGLTILTHLIRAGDLRHLWVGRFEVAAVVAPGVAARIAASVAAALERQAGAGRLADSPLPALPAGRPADPPLPALPAGRPADPPLPALPAGRPADPPLPALPAGRPANLPLPALPAGRGQSLTRF